MPPSGVALVLVAVLCHPPPIPQTLTVKQRLLHMDWAGAVLLLGSMVCLLIALQQGGLAWAWSSSQIIGLLVGFFAITAAFFVLQGFLGERSSISLRLMRNRSLAAVCFVNFTCGASYYSLLYYTAIFFQVVSIVDQSGTGVVLRSDELCTPRSARRSKVRRQCEPASRCSL